MDAGGAVLILGLGGVVQERPPIPKVANTEVSTTSAGASIDAEGLPPAAGGPGMTERAKSTTRLPAAGHVPRHWHRAAPRQILLLTALSTRWTLLRPSLRQKLGPASSRTPRPPARSRRDDRCPANNRRTGRAITCRPSAISCRTRSGRSGIRRGRYGSTQMAPARRRPC